MLTNISCSIFQNLWISMTLVLNSALQLGTWVLLLTALSILLRGFKEFKMQQPDQYLEHPDLSTFHHSSTTCMVSVLLPTTVPLHEIPCHSHSDINRNLIASSQLWKLTCLLSINVIIMFSMLLRTVIYVFRSLFVWFMRHVGVCPTELS